MFGFTEVVVYFGIVEFHRRLVSVSEEYPLIMASGSVAGRFIVFFV